MKRLFVFIAVLTMALISAEFPVFADPGASAKEQKGASPAFSGVGSYPKSRKKPVPKAETSPAESGGSIKGGWDEGQDEKAEQNLISNLVVVLNSDYSITLYNEEIDPKNSFDALGIKRLAKGYPYFQIDFAHQFSLTAVNNTKDYADFYADGNPLGKSGENCSPPPEAYEGSAKIWSPYLWRDLRPGESRYVDGLHLGGFMKFHFVSGGADSTFMLMVH